jgi:hypothetical protein
MTRRENVRSILIERFSTLRDAAGGNEALNQLVENATTEIMDLTRPPEEIIHVIGPNGQHRLIVDGKTTDWKSQTELATLGDFVAATDFYMGQIPQVSKVRAVDPKHFNTTSQQNLHKTEIKFVRPE